MPTSTSTLFKNATIITYEASTKSLKTLRNASMLVEDGRITQLSEGDLSDCPSNTETIDASNKIISPGFIDTHHHMWQTAFRTIAADTTLHEYFRLYGPSPAYQYFTPDDMYHGQLASALELVDCGTTTVLDHAHGTFSDEHVDAVVKADFDSGLRIMHAHVVQPSEALGYSYEKSLAKFKNLLADPRFADKNNPVELGLAYDGFLSAPPERTTELINVIINHNQNPSQTPLSCLTAHYVGGPYGFDQNPTTLHNLPTSLITQPTLTHKLPILLSHASFLSQTDAALLRRNPHVTISITPESEAHYGHTSHGADMAQDCASLGVDTHFTFSAYLPSQARLWLQLQRSKWYSQTAVVNGEVPANNPMSVADAFLLATQKGGEALGRDDVGVISVGARADVVVFGCERPGMWGVREGDPVAGIVLHSCAGDVEGVMVGGRWVKREGRLVSPLVGGGRIEVAEVRRRFEESARRIRGIWEGLEKPVFTAGEDTGFGVARYGRCKTVEVRR
ncbi:hypothetical protein LTR70_007791 [Exophiala xenobiotica]|uniref:Amidohydrolase-related domain-containing protein n=1 Tax=Lithohypha guttulata TaxID=1690604 RepID=A0ABR0JZG2_9EURO|nr:hypothetical protein LTR24_008613 [Lithohypha guttulata]KAK5313099.1 hypothetical protein LTR70_007791 [Exophiala xenobiotica]